MSKLHLATIKVPSDICQGLDEHGAVGEAWIKIHTRVKGKDRMRLQHANILNLEAQAHQARLSELEQPTSAHIDTALEIAKQIQKHNNETIPKVLNNIVHSWNWINGSEEILPKNALTIQDELDQEQTEWLIEQASEIISGRYRATEGNALIGPG